MKTDSLKLTKVFSSGGDVLYLLPHFQREYAWEKTHWETLIKDVFSVYDEYADDSEPEHFMGSLVVINDGTRSGTIPAFKLVDGQQRLVTVSLLLCALSRLIRESHANVARKIQKLLINEDEEGLFRYKVLPTTKYGDQTAYLAILDGVSPLPTTESRVPVAFEYMGQQINNRLMTEHIDPERLFKVLANCLQFVFIELNEAERPFEIFESLNAKGKPLSQADLVRNYIAMRLPEAKQADIFNQYWAVIETLLQEKRTVGRSRLGELTAFLRHYLTMLSGTLCNEDHVYARFRDRAQKEFARSEAFAEELAKLKRYAEYYDRLLRPDNEPGERIRYALKRLNTLEISTAYPFLLAAYDALDREQISEKDFLDVLDVLENYMVRRYLAGEPANYLNKMFPLLWREIDLARLVPSLKQVLVGKSYPGDGRLRQAAFIEELYDRRSQTREKTCLILESVNKYLSAGSGGFTALDGAPTIEHIMPQTLDASWRKMLGSDGDRVYRECLHTLGNLTLVTQEWNSTLSNAPFAAKKERLARHALKINSTYFAADLSRWDEAAIRQRAEFIVQNIIDLWPALGEPPTPQSIAYPKPKAVTILNDTYPVQTWREVAYYTAEQVSQAVDNFDAVAQQMPSYFSKEKFQYACRQLSNGWWLYLNLSGASVKTLCLNLVTAANLSDEDWQLKEE